MTQKLNYTLTLPVSVKVPVATGKKRTSLKNLERLLKKLASGHIPGSFSLAARQNAVAASATVTCASVVSGNTITLSGQALTAAQRHATGTITCAGVDADDTVTVQSVVLTAKQHRSRATITITIANTDVDDTVTVNGVVFTAKNATDTAEGEFDISGTATVAATALAACINASEDPLIDGILTAVSSAGVVTVLAVATGTAGDGLTLETSDADGLAVSGAVTAGGTAVGASQFDMSGSNAETATSLGAALTANATIAALMTNTVASNVVTLRSILTGTAGNAYTLVSSDGTDLAVTGAGTLTNGAAESNNTFDYTGTNAQTAVKIAAAINASTTDIVEHIVSAEASGDTVVISAKVPGYSGNAVTIATSGATLTITGGVSRLTGGTETLVTI
jgi:hypothetical protein